MADDASASEAPRGELAHASVAVVTFVVGVAVHAVFTRCRRGRGTAATTAAPAAISIRAAASIATATTRRRGRPPPPIATPATSRPPLRLLACRHRR